MSFDPNTERRILAVLKKLGVRQECLACSAPSPWDVKGFVSACNVQSGEQEWSLVEITCHHCGYTMLFETSTLGIEDGEGWRDLYTGR